jgi:hypothetical protein
MKHFLRALLLLVSTGLDHGAAKPTSASDPDAASGVVVPRDVLRLFEVDESVLRFFRDGEMLAADELEPIYRLLYVLPRFDTVQRHQWRQLPESWDTLAANPGDHRANLYLVMGRVDAIVQHALPAEAARRFGYDHFYVLTIQSAVDQRVLSVCAREIPSTWSLDASGQPISCDALFIKTGEGTPRESLIFVTDRIAWHPRQPDASQEIDAGQALLGSHGMDVSRLSEVIHEQPLVASDREGFYQMLWAMRRMDPTAIAAVADNQPLPVVRLLQRPETQVGHTFRMQGTARRAIRVLVEDPDIRQRFGIDHYYEVELFTPLEQILRLVDARDGQARSYRNFPVTVCTAELPPGMPQGDEIRQAIDVDAFFFKLWTYPSRFAAGEGETAAAARRQVSPLLMAPTVRLVRTPTPANPRPGWIMAIIVASIVAASLAVRCWYSRRDRPFQQWRQARDRHVVIHVPEPPRSSGDAAASSDPAKG